MEREEEGEEEVREAFQLDLRLGPLQPFGQHDSSHILSSLVWGSTGEHMGPAPVSQP